MRRAQGKSVAKRISPLPNPFIPVQTPGTKGIGVLWVTGEYFDGMRAAELAARGKLDAPAQTDPFLRLDWFRRVWEQSPPGERPLIVRARSGAAEAWLFLARTRPGRAASLTAAHTHRFAPVFSGDPDPGLRHNLIRAVARRLRIFGIARLVMDAVPAADAALLSRAFRSAGWVVSDRAGPPNFRLDVAGRSFDDCRHAAPGRLHAQVDAGNRHLQIEITDLMAPHMWDEVALLGGTDGFVRELAQDATLDRTLRLGIARVGDAPVAAQIWTFEQGTGIAHWRGEDPAAAQFHPSAELTAAMLRQLIDVDQAVTIDFGSEASLADWAGETQPLHRMEMLDPRAAASWAPAIAKRLTGVFRRSTLT